ncbi:MAG: hypothetical protein AB7V77_01250 [Candidatus Woesearchaeota archaeon]
MKDKQIWIDFSEEVDADYKELQKKVLQEKEEGFNTSFNIQLLKSIDREKNNIKIDPQYGTHIPRRNISKEVIKRYGTDRLWKVDLVGYWRMIYTLVGDEVKIVALILEFMDHKKYDKVFDYKKK